MGTYQRDDSPFWYYRFQYGGQRYAGSTGETDRRAAQKVERRIRAQVEARAPGLASQAVGLAEVGTLDMDRANAAKNSPGEIKTLQGRWQLIIKILGKNTHPKRIGPAEIHHLAAELAKRGQRGQTVRKHMTALKRGLKLAERQGWIQGIPGDWPVIKSDPPKETQKGRLHPPEVLAAWLSKLKGSPLDEATVALHTGLRWGELRRLHESWVQPSPPGSPCTFMIAVPAPGAKTRIARVIPLTVTAFEIIKRRAKSNPLIFGAVARHRGAYNTAAKKIKYDQHITLRDLRHQWATLADYLTGDRRTTQEILGHTSEQVTARYLHSTAARLSNVVITVGKWLDANLVPQTATVGGDSEVK